MSTTCLLVDDVDNSPLQIWCRSSGRLTGLPTKLTQSVAHCSMLSPMSCIANSWKVEVCWGHLYPLFDDGATKGLCLCICFWQSLPGLSALPVCITPQWLQPRKFEIGCGTACWPLVWRMLWEAWLTLPVEKLPWPRQLLHSMARGLFVGHGALEEEMFPECPNMSIIWAHCCQAIWNQNRSAIAKFARWVVCGDLIWIVLQVVLMILVIIYRAVSRLKSLDRYCCSALLWTVDHYGVKPKKHLCVLKSLL